MQLLLENIGQLVQVEEYPAPWVSGKNMAQCRIIPDAFLLIRDEVIADFGPMKEMGRILLNDNTLVEMDCSGRLVLPAWCDSHTHIVYAGSREMEFVGRIKGLTYRQIADAGGGILNSAALLHETSEEDLYRQAVPRVKEMIRHGTGAMEIKSGYGLNTEDELKMLRVIRRLQQSLPVCIRATFLGAHAVPERFRGNSRAYVNEIIYEMIPMVAAEELADFIDVFCEEGYFSVEDTDRILMAGMKHGLRPKIHANEMAFSGGVQVGVKYNALSVDHLEYLGEEEIAALMGSETMPAILPGASFFLGMPYAPARRLIDAGLPVALATDFNPGSSPSGNMPLIGSFACLKQKLLPAEVVNAMTINGAYAMGISDRLGSIARGKIANLFITRKMPGVDYLFYSYGSNPVDVVILNGEINPVTED
ncbi:MAG: imidazolonepropionase [Prolixibacteraceae bacterium]|jgi:imidazolonepropionase|nr:imidazolonepropionase [Prolixibacteraceae bacterium]MDI9563182.1 imidazolonepropionase [Bacteroidota bacterium]NLT00410.1 imidazolonepropionase [Bacteroidales bacterium]OQB81169.1 MAG: Imidazolonepropionase [Bacteroidetes bacterium ADurb.Bin123]HNZ68521.1 imidazolonepropionase [Prolixibacteraceae bacterium]